MFRRLEGNIRVRLEHFEKLRRFKFMTASDNQDSGFARGDWHRGGDSGWAKSEKCHSAQGQEENAFHRLDGVA
jgi:hypothetical protein